MIDDDI
jgi:translation initiation factor 5B